jgi:hypothetical protein
VIAAIQHLAWSLLGWLRRSPRMWELVQNSGIVVFVGPNGSGKSLAAVQATLPALRGIAWTCDQLAHHHNEELRRHIDVCAPDKDVVCDRDTSKPTTLCDVGQMIGAACCAGTRLVYSTVPLLGANGEPHDLYRPLVDFRQLVTIEHAEVIFDEVAGIADASSDSSSMPQQVTNWLHQLRKRDVRLRVTTPAYSRCAKQIRQVAQLVVDARSFFPEHSEAGRLWRPRRAMLFRAFDGFGFEDFTSSVSKGDRIKPLAGAAFWRPGSEAAASYDTLGAVQALGHVLEGGMCAICGGARSRPRCACDHAVDDVAADRLVVRETVGASGARVRRAEIVDVPGGDGKSSGPEAARAAGPPEILRPPPPLRGLRRLAAD